MRTFYHWVVAGLPVADALLLALFLAWAASLQDGATRALPTDAVMLLVVPMSLFLFRKLGVYDSHRVEGVRIVAANLIKSHAAAAAAACAMVLAARADTGLRGILLAFGGALLLQLVVKSVVYVALRYFRQRGGNTHQVLFLGSWEDAKAFDEQLRRHPHWGLSLDVVRPTASSEEFYSYAEGEVVGESAEGVLRSRVIHEVVISGGPQMPPDTYEQAIRFAGLGLQVRLMLAPRPANGHASGKDEHFEFGPVSVADSPMSEGDLALKRVFDLVITGLLLPVAFPLAAILALAIKLTSPGPVLYTQTRVGIYGNRFKIYKFRTMIDGAEYLMRHAHRSITKGPVFKDPNDQRITALGRILRRSSLDELPQLWNVLRGDMSLVGPRPLPLSEAEQIDGAYRRRFCVPPGLTCIWQVSGRSSVTFDRWMQYDLQYIDRWSLWFDTCLILRTIPAVLSGRGAY